MIKIFGRSLAILAILVLNQACSPAPNTATPGPSLTETLITEEPTQAYRVYVPAVQSSGGKTPAGEEGTSGTAIPPTGAGTLNTPEAGTEAAPDPHVEVQADRTTLKAGETMTITGTPVEISNPSYEINVRDAGLADVPSLAQVTYSNQVTPLDGKSGVLEFVSAQGGLDGATFVLRAKAPGTTTVTVIATGEIHNPGPGQASWTGQGSGSVDITVTN